VVHEGPKRRTHDRRKFFYRQKIDDGERQERRRQQHQQRRYASWARNDWEDRESNLRRGERQNKTPVEEEKPLAIIHIFISDNEESPSKVKNFIEI